MRMDNWTLIEAIYDPDRNLYKPLGMSPLFGPLNEVRLLNSKPEIGSLWVPKPKSTSPLLGTLQGTPFIGPSYEDPKP